MAEYHLTFDDDGDMDLITSESLADDLLLSDELVMDWLLKLELEDSRDESDAAQLRQASKGN